MDAADGRPGPYLPARSACGPPEPYGYGKSPNGTTKVSHQLNASRPASGTYPVKSSYRLADIIRQQRAEILDRWLEAFA